MVDTIDPDFLSKLPLDELEATLQQLADHRRFNKIEFFEPYQQQWKFIALGKTKKERLLTAGNQLGKSECGGYEVACHLTGLYPPNWPGKIFTEANDWWCIGVTATSTRDIQQAKLFGPPGSEEEFGTGFIPKHAITKRPSSLRNVPDAFDTGYIYHFKQSHQARNNDLTDDGISSVQFKSGEQGRAKLQGKKLTGGVWWDEEPEDPDAQGKYDEGMARVAATEGLSMMTFTPLKGYSRIVARFLEQHSDNREVVKFRATECPHMSPEQIEMNKSVWPEHEWEARLNGEPKLGQGAIFRTPEESIKFPVSQMIPEHWPLLWGIDLGFTHPFAAVLSAWDRDRDVIYITRAFKVPDALPIVHVETMREICASAPVAWPHDGAKRDGMGSGEAIAKSYKALGLKMLDKHASFVGGGISTEACILEMQQRFASGKLRIREDLEELFIEIRGYHRDENGMIVKVRDDLISAVMKVIMAKRHGKPVEMGWQAREMRSQKRRPAGRHWNVATGQYTYYYDR